MTLEETLKSVKEAFVGKSAEAEAKASEVNALSAKVAELTEGLVSKEASIVELSAKLADASAKLAVAEAMFAKAEAQAKEIQASQESVGKKAASIAASVGVSPVEVTPGESAAVAKSDDEVAQEWASLKQQDGKLASEFYTKNRTAILRAAGLR
jgi:chromosome segregation ATPase